jgi:hypothetical protein
LAGLGTLKGWVMVDRVQDSSGILEDQTWQISDVAREISGISYKYKQKFGSFLPMLFRILKHIIIL